MLQSRLRKLSDNNLHCAQECQDTVGKSSPHTYKNWVAASLEWSQLETPSMTQHFKESLTPTCVYILACCCCCMNPGWWGAPIPIGIPWGGTPPILLKIAGCWFGRACCGCCCCCGAMYIPPGTPYIWGWLPWGFGAYNAIMLSAGKISETIEEDMNVNIFESFFTHPILHNFDTTIIVTHHTDHQDWKRHPLLRQPHNTDIQLWPSGVHTSKINCTHVISLYKTLPVFPRVEASWQKRVLPNNTTRWPWQV